MERDEKIKVAITAGIAGAILLILVLYLAITSSIKNGSDNDDGKTPVTAEASFETTKADDSTSQATKEDLSANEASSNGASLQTDSSSEKVSKETADADKLTDKKGKTTTVSGNSFYVTEAAELKDVYKKIAYEVAPQLKEMAGYWSDGNMAAVSDLAHLERFEIMSLSLKGTKNFYYFGDTNANGEPEGKGLALYADDQYYYGDWANGARSGEGTWISFYPAYSGNVVTYHQYTGTWAGDLPNGRGQEHIDYEMSRMNDVDLYVQNAIGEFVNGYYHGKMYIITVDNNYLTKEWYGDCEAGSWKQVLYTAKDNKGRIAVMDEKDNSENHIWMYEKDAKENGIKGLISGGKMVTK